MRRHMLHRGNNYNNSSNNNKRLGGISEWSRNLCFWVLWECEIEVPMAELEEDGRLPPAHFGHTAVPSDEAAGKTHCEVSVLNGDCGISENMMCSGSPLTPGSQTGVEAANTSVGPDAKSDIPRRSSIIKVIFEVGAVCVAFWCWSYNLPVHVVYKVFP